MTLSDARQLLQVEADTPPSEVRRAYMRAVRRHPPDRDPEQFRRVREAFESLQAATDPNRDLDSNRPSPPQFDGETAEQSEQERPDPPKEPTDATEDNAPSNVEWFVLRARAENAADPDDWSSIAAVFSRLTEVADHGQPPVSTALTMILALHATARHEEGDQLFRAVERWIEAQHSEVRALPGTAVYRWALVVDITRSRVLFPDAPWHAIARACLDGRARWAGIDLFEYARRDPARAIAFAAAMASNLRVLQIPEDYVRVAQRVLAHQEPLPTADELRESARRSNRKPVHGGPSDEDLLWLNSDSASRPRRPLDTVVFWLSSLIILIVIGAIFSGTCGEPPPHRRTFEDVLREVETSVKPTPHSRQK